jgi:probable phosphoglycerate mutase
MSRVIIIRHGNTFNQGDTVLRVGSRTDLPLTKGGEEQLNLLAFHFKEHGIFPSKIYCGALQRATKSAVILSEVLHAPIIKDSRFNEVDYGSDDGLPESDVIARVGEKALKEWEEFGTPPSGWNINAAEIKERWRTFFLNELSSHDELIFVVTSNGVARFALQMASNFTSFPLKLRTGAYGELEIDKRNSEIVVKSWDLRVPTS